jgi:hypothetical protein
MGGAMIPLGQVAKVSISKGAPAIRTAPASSSNSNIRCARQSLAASLTRKSCTPLGVRSAASLMPASTSCLNG